MSGDTPVEVGGPPLVRPVVIAQVADSVPTAVGEDCVRVAVDGVDGSGKTVFADELAAELAARGRSVVRVSADDWHQVRELRYARGRASPEGFWLDSYDYARLRAEVLEPLGPGGSRDYRPRGHDLESDEVLTGPLSHAPAGSVVLVDGLFLQRAELDGCFDFAIWLDVPFEETAARMARRDGTSPDPEDPSLQRYVGAQRTYFAERTPWNRADLVVDNTDLAAPFVVTGRFD
jgi:uridine kinase